jgi:hypothetical protein
MTQYEYHKITTLAEQMEAAGIAPEVREQILAGGEEIHKGTAPERKAAWLKGAMQRMDQLIEHEARHAIREACACCLGGKRLLLSKAIAKEHATLEERIAAANATRMVFGHSVTMQEDGQVLVAFSPEGQESYRCVCVPKAKEPLSITYCYCCGGHVKHHLQTALGRPMTVKVRSSALSSGGSKPCTFLLAFAE